MPCALAFLPPATGAASNNIFVPARGDLVSLMPRLLDLTDNRQAHLFRYLTYNSSLCNDFCLRSGVLSLKIPRNLDKSRHFTVHLFRPWSPSSAHGIDGGPPTRGSALGVAARPRTRRSHRGLPLAVGQRFSTAVVQDLATTPSPNRDLGAETFPRDEMECPAQGELFRVLGRCLPLNQNAPAVLSDHEMPDATMSFLANSFLDLLDKSYHEAALLG